METYSYAFLLIALAITLAPLIVELSKWPIPVLVVEILIGILIGPHGFHLASNEGVISDLGQLGFVFLLFLTGIEIDFAKIRGKALSLAVSGWLVSFAVATLAMLTLNAIGLVKLPPLIAAVAISTTALAVLTPILRDRNELDNPFGTYVIAAATVGEFAPLIIISLVFIPSHHSLWHTLLVLVSISLAFYAAYAALNTKKSRIIAMVEKTLESSGQLPVRICLFFQILLAALAVTIGLNVVIGAFAAGIIVGFSMHGKKGELLKQKLDAIGYGFLIPIFFVVMGMKFDIQSLWADPLAPIQVILLIGLILLARGVPVYLYRKDLKESERPLFVLYSSTTLPMIIAISEIGVSTGAITSTWASILVSAGVISVIVFPVLAARVTALSKSIQP